MIECFFSAKYAGRNDLFEDLDVWKHEEYRSLQGTYPVICISFADVKAVSFVDFMLSIKLRLSGVFDEFQSVLDRVDVTERERVVLNAINADMKGPVKKWYDGFVFGGHRDIYNPWSITCFLKRRRLDTYWTSTSSNALISNTLESMAGKALRQIEDKKYDAELLDSGIEPDRIHHYGFTFEGKDVLIVGE